MVDFYLSEHRDIEAAKRFFRLATFSHGSPEKIRLDGHAGSRRAVAALKVERRLSHKSEIRSCACLNNRQTN